MCIFLVFSIRFSPRIVNFSEFLPWMSCGNSRSHTNNCGLDIAASRTPCSQDTRKRSLITHPSDCRAMFLWQASARLHIPSIHGCTVHCHIHVHQVMDCKQSPSLLILIAVISIGPIILWCFSPCRFSWELSLFNIQIVLPSCLGFPTAFKFDS